LDEASRIFESDRDGGEQRSAYVGRGKCFCAKQWTGKADLKSAQIAPDDISPGDSAFCVHVES